MRADRVDPRDVSWEDELTYYRVYFWTYAREGGSEGDLWRSDEWRIADAPSFFDVFTWALGRSNLGTHFTIYAEVRGHEGLGIVRLFGTDPTSEDGER